MIRDIEGNSHTPFYIPRNTFRILEIPQIIKIVEKLQKQVSPGLTLEEAWVNADIAVSTTRAKAVLGEKTLQLGGRIIYQENRELFQPRFVKSGGKFC